MSGAPNAPSADAAPDPREPAELWQLSKLIRSKNAGPFELTFDIMFSDEASYRRVRDSGALAAERVAPLFHLSPDEVRYFEHDGAMAIKLSIPRPAFSGDVKDTDVFGGQFHSPLVRLVIPPASQATPHHATPHPGTENA